VVFYVDGVADLAAPFNATPFTFGAPGYIGAWRNAGGLLDSSFYGAIDELSVYGRELSAAEIQAIYAAGSNGKCVGSFRVVQAPQLTNAIPTIITLTNTIPYLNTNSGAGNTADYYRFAVSTNAARAQFEINRPSADLTLVAQKGLPLPNLASFDYISANPSTNDEWIVVLTNSVPVPLSAGDWYLSVFNLSGGPASYAIKATEWPVTGRPITVTGINITAGGFCISWDSLPGVHYYLEGLTNLNSTAWITASPTITATGVSTTNCVPLPSPLHFFRVREGIVLFP
jgi:hypothetical protein